MLPSCAEWATDLGWGSACTALRRGENRLSAETRYYYPEDTPESVLAILAGGEFRDAFTQTVRAIDPDPLADSLTRALPNPWTAIPPPEPREEE